MSFFAELKRRKVFRVAVVYAATAFVLLQASDLLTAGLGLPDWFFPVVTVLLLLGFPVALVMGWALELTPEGVKVAPRRGQTVSEEQPPSLLGRRTVLLAGAMVFLGIGLGAGWFLKPTPTLPEAEPDPVATIESETDAEDFAQPVTEPVRTSIAVLPFVNMSPDPEQEYFSDGLSEEILNLLAQIRELTVIGRTSSFAFKGRNVDLREIGDTLGVSHLLEGSVRKAGDDLRITAQLIRADTGAHLWSQTYDRRLENVFEIQSDIAGAIAEALRISLLGPDDAPPVVQVTAVPAYERFLQARRLVQGRTRTGLESARDLLDEALVLDPDYAPAHALAGQTVLLLAATPVTYGDIPLDEAAAAAQALIDRALALDPQLAEAHAVRGLQYDLQRDLTHAETALARALEINPNLSDALHWQASNFSAAGRLRDSLAVRRRLAEIDPLNVANLGNLSLVLARSAKYEEAEAVAMRIQRGFPESAFGFERLALVLLFSGRLADAHASAERALALAPDSRFVQSQVGHVFFALGDFDRVLALPGSAQHGPALIALRRVDEAVAAARAQMAAREDFVFARILLHTLSLAGRHDEVLAEYGERWGDLAALEAFFRFDQWSSEMAPIAAAQRALGQDQALAETLERWSQRLVFMREHGYAYSTFRAIEASHLVLAGQRDAALTTLAEAIDQGWRDPLLGIDPAFAELHDQPAFQVQVARMAKLINAERASLDWEPLP